MWNKSRRKGHSSQNVRDLRDFWEAWEPCNQRLWRATKVIELYTLFPSQLGQTGYNEEEYNNV